MSSSKLDGFIHTRPPLPTTEELEDERCANDQKITINLPRTTEPLVERTRSSESLAEIGSKPKAQQPEENPPRTKPGVRPEEKEPINSEAKPEPSLEAKTREKPQIKRELSPSPAPLLRDNTQHFELDIGVDIVEELEEFCRLKRVGYFQDAEQHLRTVFSEFFSFSLVKMEYADLLLEQGAYRRFYELSIEDTISTPRLLSANYAAGSSASMSVLSQDLMRLIYFFAADGGFSVDVKRCLDAVGRRFSQKTYNIETQYDSFAIVVIRDWLKVVSCLRTETDIVSIGNWTPMTMAISWEKVYHHLLLTDRVWDFRDLLLAMAEATSPKKAWKYLTGTKLSSPGQFRLVYDQWITDEYEYDESTTLAFVDIFSSLASQLLYRIPHHQALNQSKEITRQCLNEAKQLALIIGNNSPDLVRSRPYLRYILSNAQAERILSGERPITPGYQVQPWHEHFSKFPGLAICYDGCPPIYLPTHAENPGWCSPVPSLKAIQEQLQQATDVAHEMGDHQTEALLLKELICHLPEPQKQMERLITLQRSMGNALDYLKSLLSQYLLANNDDSRRSLCTEIAQYRPPNIYECAPLINFCATRVLTALHRALGDPPGIIGAAITRSLELQDRLPGYLRRVVGSSGGEFSVWGRGTVRPGGEKVIVLRRRIALSEKRQRWKRTLTSTDSSADGTDLTDSDAGEYPRPQRSTGQVHTHKRSMPAKPYQATIEDATDSSGGHDESEYWLDSEESG